MMSTFRVGFVSLVLALCLTSGRAAGQERTVTYADSGSIYGVVFDSLMMRPLGGANVFVPAAGKGAITDPSGRFRVDDVPAGPQFIALSHPALDALGLTTLGAEVPVRPSDSVFARLATPSLATLRRQACGDDAPEEPPGRRIFGLVFGSVGSALDGARLAGASVHARWMVADSSSGAVRVESVETEAHSDATGHYYLCDVPVQREIWITGRGGELVSARTDLLLDARGVARHDLLLAPDDSSVAARSAPGTIVGVLRDTSGRSLPDTRILVDGVKEAAVTDSAGRFTISGVPAGSRMLEARPQGLAALRRPIAATPGDTLRLELRAGGGVMLDPVTVRATARVLGREMRGFEERRSLGQGIFFDSTEIRSRGSMRAVANSLPSARLEGTFTRWDLRVLGQGGYCVPTVWVDGRLTDWEEVSATNAESVQAVEYYGRPGITPQRFMTPSNRLCGTAVIWTNGVR